MKCPRCQHEAPRGGRLCPKCGASLRPIARRRPQSGVEPILNAIAKTAARLCDAHDALIFLVDGDHLRHAAHHGSVPTTRAIGEAIPLNRGTVYGRALLDRRTIHVRDLKAAVRTQYPEIKARQQATGVRTMLAAPLLADGSAVGVISIRRRQVRPFTSKQIALLKTFADQAAVAVENARLSEELETRNRDLTVALEQQTATSEILRVISSSPTDLEPVLEAVAENAARLCEAPDVMILRIDGDIMRIAARRGPWTRTVPLDQILPITRGSVSGRAVVDRRTVHVHDLSAEPDEEYPAGKEFQRRWGHRTMLATPLLREGIPLGVIGVFRTEVRAFSDTQIKLLQTFADQAVIAIENVRLFNELQARNRDLTVALEQQTATSEILRVISSSQTDVQPVFETIAASAVRLCRALFSVVSRRERDLIHVAAQNNLGPAALEEIGRSYPIPVDRESITGRTLVDRRVVHVRDVETDPDVPGRGRELSRALGFRTVVSVPMLREGEAIGAIAVARAEPEPFSEQETVLLQTFADQAVIAIENVRLFNELQARTAELTRSVGELKALGEVGQAVSSTLDLQTVLATIVTRAVELSGTDGGVIYEYDEATQTLRLRAAHRMDAELVEVLRIAPLRLGEGATGQAAASRTPIQVPDTLDGGQFGAERIRSLLVRLGYRSVLAVPLLAEKQIMGALTVWRLKTGTFSPEVVNLLQTFATQSALAIRNAQLFRELEEKGRELAVASRHKSQFLANMSHELRTPLNAILGYTELLLDSIYGELPGKARETMERIDRSGRHLLALINDVLDLSKIEAGQLTLSLAEYSLREIVQTVATAMEPLAATKSLALKVSVAPDLPVGRGDERRINQVLLNLVGNAIKFTDSGEVRVTAGVSDGAFLVSVADTGPGIAPEDHERMFEEFQQADSSNTRKKGGTGLGLSIARRIIELHGGRIWVESAPGQGSTFFFTVPVRVERQVGVA
jgi:signal transduction histidine kinase